MKIAVGSTNPVKIEAVRTVVTQVWGNTAVSGIAVPSGVSEMPMSDEACITGAKNRALAAQQQLQADFGIGLEGGVQEQSFGLALVGWVAVIDKEGRVGIGGGTRLLLPSHIAQRVRAGEELGPIMDDILQVRNVKQKGGAVGALTAGLVMRQEAFSLAVAYAIAPFVSSTLYLATR